MSNTNLPRGYRNNNPLNIRYYAGNSWKGKVLPNTDRNNTFEQFINMAYGYRAALYLLRKYINEGNNTVEKIISRWAPPSENNTQGYINDVCRISNSTFGTQLTPDTIVSANNARILCDMAYAMSICENGNTAESKAAGLPDINIINEAWNLL